MAGGARNSTTQTVQKAVHVLNCFTTSATRSLSVTELTAMTGWGQSSVSRLLSALEAGGLVQQDGATGRYTLGLQLVALAGTALAASALYSTSHPHLIHLAVASGETTNLCVLEGLRVLTIDEVLGTHPIKLSGWLGMRHPIHATAGGKVLLAASPEAYRDVVLNAGLPVLTPKTIANRERLEQTLEQVRSAGYALTVEELSLGLVGIAAPVRDHTGAVVAAMTAGGPSFRLMGRHLDDCIALVKEEAEAVSRALGSSYIGRVTPSVVAS